MVAHRRFGGGCARPAKRIAGVICCGLAREKQGEVGVKQFPFDEGARTMRMATRPHVGPFCRMGSTGKVTTVHARFDIQQIEPGAERRTQACNAVNQSPNPACEALKKLCSGRRGQACHSAAATRRPGPWLAEDFVASADQSLDDLESGLDEQEDIIDPQNLTVDYKRVINSADRWKF
jgi:hypothetical protein